MTKTLLLITMMTATVAAGTVSIEPTIQRLDGSTIVPTQIDATVTRLMRAAEVTGVSIAIFNDGKIAYLKSYGVADKEQSLPLTEDSVMTAASFTKVAFAYLVMKLVDEKIIPTTFNNGHLEGSLQQMLGENVTLGGSTTVSRVSPAVQHPKPPPCLDFAQQQVTDSK